MIKPARFRQLATEHLAFVGGGMDRSRVHREGPGASEMFCDTIDIDAAKLNYLLRMTAHFTVRPCDRRPMDRATCS